MKGNGLCLLGDWERESFGENEELRGRTEIVPPFLTRNASKGILN